MIIDGIIWLLPVSCNNMSNIVGIIIIYQGIIPDFISQVPIDDAIVLNTDILGAVPFSLLSVLVFKVQIDVKLLEHFVRFDMTMEYLVNWRRMKEITRTVEVLYQYHACSPQGIANSI